jgi:hypothetical protein
MKKVILLFVLFSFSLFAEMQVKSVSGKCKNGNIWMANITFDDGKFKRAYGVDCSGNSWTYPPLRVDDILFTRITSLTASSLFLETDVNTSEHNFKYEIIESETGNVIDEGSDFNVHQTNEINISHLAQGSYIFIIHNTTLDVIIQSIVFIK